MFLFSSENKQNFETEKSNESNISEGVPNIFWTRSIEIPLELSNKPIAFWFS